MEDNSYPLRASYHVIVGKDVTTLLDEEASASANAFADSSRDASEC